MFGLGPSVRSAGSARGARDVRLGEDDDDVDTTNDDDDVAMRTCDMVTTDVKSASRVVTRERRLLQ